MWVNYYSPFPKVVDKISLIGLHFWVANEKYKVKILEAIGYDFATMFFVASHHRHESGGTMKYNEWKA